MKKSYIVGGILGLAVVVGLGVFMKKKSSEPNLSEDSAIVDADSAHGTTPSSSPKTEDSVSGSQQSKAASTVAPVASSDDPKMKKIDNFLVHSQILNEFKAMDELLESQLEQIQDAAQLSASDQEELEQLKKIVSSERLLANYKNAMHQNMSEDELNQLNETYQDPAVAQVKDAQVYNQTPAGQKELMEYFKTFKMDSLSADRVAALEAADGALGTQKQTMKMLESMASMGPNGNSKDSKAMFATMEKTIKQASVMQLSKTFKDKSVEDIKAYTQKVSNPAFQKEVNIKGDTMIGAVKEVSTHVQESQKRHQESKGDHHKDDADKK